METRNGAIQKRPPALLKMPLGLMALLLFFVAGVAAHAQATGNISGRVMDSEQAAIPHARITVTNQGTNETRTVEANGAGEFTVTLLPSGTYSVLAEKEGFAGYLQKNIILSANTTASANLILKPASVTQETTVNADASLIQATSTVLTQVVDQRRIEDLPLNGRNILDLMTINAGVSDAGAVGSTSQIQNLKVNVPVSINGARGDSINYLLDDADNNDYYAKISLPFPNPDAVKEFSIQTSSFDARYGRAGGVVNVVTKSGTNAVHGSVFEYIRNYAMNAADYFSGRDTLKRNQFGGSIGGPFWLPKIYNGRDRTFAFFAYQGTRFSSSTPAARYTTPSQAMKNGDFSAWLQGTKGKILDPLTGLPFPNNQIPTSRFDPVAVKMLALMPASDPADGYQVRLATPTVKNSQNELVGRMDHQLTKSQHLFFRAFQYYLESPWGYAPDNLYFIAAGQKAHSRNLDVDHAWVISNRWVNSFNYAHNVTESNSIQPPELAARSLQGYGARVMVLPNQPTLTAAITGWTGFNIGQGYMQVQKNDEFADILNFVNGHHDLRIGGYFRHFSLDKTAPFSSGGSITFNGQMYSQKGQNNAGNAFAEFVLGKASNFTQQSAWSEFLTNNYPALFIQDDWRITPRLTLNMGLRWDPQTDYTEHQARKGSTFVAGAKSQRFPNAPTGLLFTGDPGVEKYIVQPDRMNFAPRAGFAFQATPTTVLRGAYGIFYDLTSAELNNRVGAGQPFVNQRVLTGPVQMSDPYNGGPVLDPTPPTSIDPNFVFTPYGSYALPSTNMPTPYMQNWNLILEQQISNSTLARIAYVGTKGTHLITGTDINAGVYGPGATAANINSRRPIQPLGVLVYDTDSASSHYHSLQATLQRRFAHGFSILANYTWSRAMDNVSGGNGNTANSGPDPHHPERNIGLSDFDIRHHFVASGIYELPSFKNRNVVVRSVLGGWQANYIVNIRSGLSDTVVSGTDNAFSGVGGQFADVVPGQLPYLDKGRSKTDKIAKWFNTGAFTTNAIGTVGNGSRNTMRLPGYSNVNLSIFKKFPLYKEAKLQFRAEAFNLFNHANLGSPNLSANSANFGRISSTSGDPRIMQLAVRINF
ncbi:MAG: TonB-dependent receptor [Acidobacteria bacterium]|nr:TonB-dependent receptor [Acidobacteriota bacterium]